MNLDPCWSPLNSTTYPKISYGSNLVRGFFGSIATDLELPSSGLVRTEFIQQLAPESVARFVRAAYPMVMVRMVLVGMWGGW